MCRAVSPADWIAFARSVCIQDGSHIDFVYNGGISKAFDKAAPAIGLWPFFAALHAIPLLIVRGERSDILSHHTANKMLFAHSHAKLLTVSDVGHAPILDELDARCGVTAFLKKNK